MLGRSHMIVGGVSYLCVTQGAEMLGAHPSRQALACGTIVAVGSALAPDADTPNSTLGHALGPLSQAATKLIGRVFGGHRHGTHSFVWCAVAGAITALALAQTHLAKLPYGRTITIGSLVALAIGFGALTLAFSSLGRIHGGKLVVLTLVALAGAVILKPGTAWMPGAVLVGNLSHLLADFVTPEGIEPFWFFSHRRYAVGLVGHTGDAREHVIVAFVAALGLIAGYYSFRAHPHPHPRPAPAAHAYHVRVSAPQFVDERQTSPSQSPPGLTPARPIDYRATRRCHVVIHGYSICRRHQPQTTEPRWSHEPLWF